MHIITSFGGHSQELMKKLPNKRNETTVVVRPSWHGIQKYMVLEALQLP